MQAYPSSPTGNGKAKLTSQKQSKSAFAGRVQINDDEEYTGLERSETYTTSRSDSYSSQSFTPAPNKKKQSPLIAGSPAGSPRGLKQQQPQTPHVASSFPTTIPEKVSAFTGRTAAAATTTGSHKKHQQQQQQQHQQQHHQQSSSKKISSASASLKSSRKDANTHNINSEANSSRCSSADDGNNNNNNNNNTNNTSIENPLNKTTIPKTKTASEKLKSLHLKGIDLPNHTQHQEEHQKIQQHHYNALQKLSQEIVTRTEKGKATHNLVMAIVCSLIICYLIVWLLTLTSALVEPYSMALVGAAILSVALHEPPPPPHNNNNSSSGESTDNKNRQSLPNSIIQEKKAFAKNWPSLCMLAPLCAIPEYIFWALQSATSKTGIDKYPLFSTLNVHVQNLVFITSFLSLIARLSSFLFPKFTTGLIAAFLVCVAFPCLIAFLMVWFVDERRFVKNMRLFLSIWSTLIVALCFTISAVMEIRQSGQSSVRAIQNMGIEIPDNAHKMALSYILSPNTTEKLDVALKDFRFEGTSEEIFANIKAFVVNHTTTLSAAFSETQPAAQGVGIVLTNILKSVATVLIWSLGKLYEVTLFVMTLSTLLGLERTILYYGIKKIVTVVVGDTRKAEINAEKTEHRIMNELSTLFYSLWHVFVFHFLCTMIFYSAFDIPMASCVSTVGGFLALFPLSLPPMLTQVVIAIVIQYTRFRNGSEVLPIVAVGIFFYVLSMQVDLIVVSETQQSPYNKKQSQQQKKGSGSKGESSFDDANNNNNDNNQGNNLVEPGSPVCTKQERERRANAYLVTTSIVLGLTSFGPSGVVIGPIVFIAAHALWDAI